MPSVSTPAPAPQVAARVVPFVRELAAHGHRPALIGRSGTAPQAARWSMTYAELAAQVDAVARSLGTHRRLVLVEGGNDADAIVGYLGALAGGHVVLLAPAGAAAAALTTTYDPDAVVRRGASAREVEQRREGSAHDLHPDLALLLSTSGSTGSPKLVRLSHDNLQANAESIATFLGVRDDDRAVTTLPMHYCYGLSVLHSHLLQGAALVVTELSVVDRCFWELVSEERCTSFAAVPYTFDLLDRSGFGDLDLPHLRYVTQAGGRLAPDRVRRFSELGRRRGWDLVVMYGQTEATARMAYLPPELAVEHPEAIGVPVPGGALTIEPVPEADGTAGGTPGDVGEIVYTGPNVMLGYAESPADLALGRTVDVLRTGDLGRRRSDGLYEVVGRRSRFVKVFGLRLDLQQAEQVLAGHGVTAACVGKDDELVVAVDRGQDAGRLRRATGALGLPPHAVRVCRLAELPRLPTGKLDYARVSELAGDGRGAASASQGPRTARELYAELLDQPDVRDDDTFVGLGGDSLSYVEMSVRLEELLGRLPAGWHTTPVGELVPGRRRRAGRSMETGVVLRALATVLIVGTHAHLFHVQGSAHVLIALAGYNFARFQLASPDRRARLRGQLLSVARIVVPSVAWIAAAAVATGTYGVLNVLLLNSVLGSERWTRQWHFWFVEVLVMLLLGVTALLAVPAAHRAERRHPFAFPCALLGVGLVTRFGIVETGVPNPAPTLWLFALGWAAARASTTRHRLLVTAVVLAAAPGYFSDPWREGAIALGIAALTWVPTLQCPARLSRVVSVLASSSLYIYLTHWQVYPQLVQVHPVLAVVGSLAVGVAYWWVATRAMRRMGLLSAGSPVRAPALAPLLPRPRLSRAPAGTARSAAR